MQAPGTEAAFDLQAGLRALGYEAFRPGQERAIRTLLADRRLLYVAPTGGGKSLVYQLPAQLLAGTTVVISPLIALMQDQVDALRSRGVAATFLASTLDGQELALRMRDAQRGRYRLLYVAPERVGAPTFARLLRALDCPLIAIDEAHCISEWGHDFRPDYLQIGSVLAAHPNARVLACTATATPIVRDEILTRLQLGADTPQIIHGFARPNLVLRAAEVVSARDRDIRVDAQLHEALGDPRSARGAAIVYAPTRASAEDEALRLSGRGLRAGCYHAGLPGEQREATQRSFTEGTLDVVVATNAFGMGIDRADVRAVVHLAPPSSIEAYYQEVGRAGRDGERAYGLLLTSAGDMPLRRRLIESGADGERAPQAVIEHKWGLFLELMRFIEGGSCRHDAILRYFGDHAEALGGCGQCDVCTQLESAGPSTSDEDLQMLVRKALSGVARVHGRFGLLAAVKLLKGAADARLSRTGLHAVRTFGALRDQSEEWLTRLLRRLVTAGLVVFSGEDRPVVLLTDEGRAVMEGRVRARLLLPEHGQPGRARGVSRGFVVATRDPQAAAAKAGPRTATRLDAEELDDAALALFQALRAHRLAVARELGAPPYVVASDRTLRDIARLRPGDVAQLAQVHGMGKVKIARFGHGLLRVVAAQAGF